MTHTTNKYILRIIYISLIANIVLTILKLFFGYLYASPSLISDGYNSLTDILISIGLIVTLKVATKEADFNHPYGHQKYEGVMFLFLGVIVAATGLLIGYDGISMLFTERSFIPSIETVIVASITLLIKVFVTTLNAWGTKKYQSPSLKGDTFNHMSDVLVSLLVLTSVILTNFSNLYIEHIVSIIIAVFIFRTAYKLIVEGLSFIVDEAPDVALYEQIKKEILKIKGVLTIDDLKMRKHVTQLYVDVEIGADENLTLKESHDISENVHQHIENEFPDVLHIMVHVNPVKRRKK